MVASSRSRQALPRILAALRIRLPDLRQRYGVRSLGVFGSYVRGEQRRGSDVDILVEFAQEARPSLLGLVALQAELDAALGLTVDLVEKRGLKPYLGKRILDEVVWVDGGAQPAERQHGGATLRGRGSVMPREFLDFLGDIVAAVSQIRRFVAGMSFDEFAADDRTVLAVTKAVENMGEAAKRIPEDVQRTHPEIPWRDMARMRDRLAHGYFEVDTTLLWQVAVEFIPPLEPAIRRALQAEEQAEGAEEA